MQPITIIVVAITGIVCLGYFIDSLAFTHRQKKQTKRKAITGSYPFLTKEQVN